MTRLTPLLLLLSLACSKSEDSNVPDNTTPSVQLVSPVTGSAFQDATVELIGNIVDPDGDEDIASVTWSSSLDGVLVEGEAAMPVDRLSTVSATLTPGNHVITLVVTDQADAQAQDSVTIMVQDPPEASAPNIVLTDPTVDGAVDTTQPNTFTATVASDIFAAAALSGTWTLNSADGTPEVRGPDIPQADGTLSVTFETMPVGEQQLTLTVTDPEGASATATLDLVGVPGSPIDADADGFTVADGDCNDADPTILPGAEQLCDGVDNDCDGSVDNRDADSDGYIDSACTAYVGDLPTGDCADDDASVSPGVIELENGQDDNCNGEIDDGTGNYDDDGDCVCENEDCFGSITADCVLSAGDCDDTDATISPLASELCNDVDNDCNTVVADKDSDADGFVDAECADFFTGDASDCNDANININPGEADLPDAGSLNIDSNCDGVDGDASVALFVDPDAGASTTCTRQAPCESLSLALDAFQPSVHEQILMAGSAVSSGNPREIADDLFISGGYSDDFQQHGQSGVATTRIGGVSPAFVVQGAALTLQSVQVDSSRVESYDARALAVTDGELVLDSVTIHRPTVAAGEDGLDGIAGWTEAAPDGNPGYWDSIDDGDTNPGVSNPDCLGGITNRVSGFGGADGTVSEDGGDGGPSFRGPGGTVFQGGAGGEPGTDDAEPEDGADGTTQHGSGGIGGRSLLLWNGSGFTGGAGALGTLGQDGTHGRGGGGAADGREGLSLGRGNKGGSGGARGCRASSPGTGGARGWSSTGIVADNSTITVRTPSTITGGEAGNGGEGGAGARGQFGGLGGVGRSQSRLTHASGSGGDGGDGGASGGGGGGAGGNLYGVWLLGGSTLVETAELTTEGGLTGFGGVGGSATQSSFPAQGDDGDDGLTIDIFSE